MKKLSVHYVHHVTKYMICHEALIMVITRREHYFHDYISVIPILLLLDWSSLCVVDHLWPLMVRYGFYTF